MKPRLDSVGEDQYGGKIGYLLGRDWKKIDPPR